MKSVRFMLTTALDLLAERKFDQHMKYVSNSVNMIDDSSTNLSPRVAHGTSEYRQQIVKLFDFSASAGHLSFSLRPEPNIDEDSVIFWRVDLTVDFPFEESLSRLDLPQEAAHATVLIAVVEGLIQEFHLNYAHGRAYHYP